MLLNFPKALIERQFGAPPQNSPKVIGSDYESTPFPRKQVVRYGLSGQRVAGTN